MDKGLGHLHLGNNVVDEEQVYGLVNSEEAASFSRARASQSPHTPRVEGQPLKLTNGILPERQRVLRTSKSLVVSHASPLAPLRSRDRNALDDLFEHDDLQEISLDVHRYLARIYPEPCWEDNPHDFLHDFI
ncbi:MAG: hypothetical protein AAGG02_10690 [Cyanobacteria bacterium P01_H01_bin.15]